MILTDTKKAEPTSLLGKAIGIAALVYIIFLIIRTILQVRYSFRFKRLTQNVESINKKMDLLIGKKIKR